MPLAKVAVVVGVGPGLGSAVARRFAKEGYAVALVARRSESLQPVEQEIKAAGGRVLSLPVDTGVPQQVKSAAKTIQSNLGDPAVLVYNAGPGLSWPPPSILDTDPEQFAHAFDSGVTGALVWSQQVLPAMVSAGKGTIIYTGATAALRGGAKFALLAAPKFALRALSQSVAREFQPKGVHVVHAIIDGQIDLPRTRQAQPDRPLDSLLSPNAIADTYWYLHCQDKTVWTQELDMRPYVEKF